MQFSQGALDYRVQVTTTPQDVLKDHHEAGLIEDIGSKECQNMSSSELDEDEYHKHPSTERQLTFLYYWREMMLISLSTAISLHFFIHRPYVAYLRERFIHVLVHVFRQLRAQQQQRRLPIEYPLSPQPPPSPVFESRFLSDFEPVCRLGKGGFGIVFEARNKLDDCHYAVKRIRLPNKESERDKVMREVKTLAKLDHPNIVRFFNAWVESPPCGWQEDMDKNLNKLPMKNVNSCILDVSSLDLNSNSTSTSVKTDGEITDSTRDVIKKLSLPPRRNYTDVSNSYVIFQNSFAGDKSSDSVSSDESKRDSFSVDVNRKEVCDSSVIFMDDSSVNNISEIVVSETKDDVKSDNDDKDDDNDSHSRFEIQSTEAGMDSPQKSWFLYIQMQLCQAETLREWLKIHQKRENDRVMTIFNQVVHAVEYVHYRGLMHRDMKPSNIFFSDDGTVKIGDFGLVTETMEGFDLHFFPTHRHTQEVGTTSYMSPEQLSHDPYNHKVDIFSLGLILFELLHPFGTEMERIKVMENVRKRIFPNNFQSNYQDECKLLYMMLSDNPDERPTTVGIRARPPLLALQDKSIEGFSEEEHFRITRLRSLSHSISTSSSSSAASGLTTPSVITP